MDDVVDHAGQARYENRDRAEKPQLGVDEELVAHNEQNCCARQAEEQHPNHHQRLLRSGLVLDGPSRALVDELQKLMSRDGAVREGDSPLEVPEVALSLLLGDKHDVGLRDEEIRSGDKAQLLKDLLVLLVEVHDGEKDSPLPGSVICRIERAGVGVEVGDFLVLDKELGAELAAGSDEVDDEVIRPRELHRVMAMMLVRNTSSL